MASRILRSSPWRSAVPIVRRNLIETTHTPLAHPAFSRLIRSQRPHGSVALATGPSEKEDHLQGLRLRLDLNAEQLIDDHREALREVLSAVRTVPEATKRDLCLIQSEISRLGDGFFMLVVAGEYNSGKSSLVNALLGRTILAEGPTPTTSEVTKLKYAAVSAEPTLDEHGVLVLGEPVEVLASRLQVVDTPGTNAIDRSHEALTRDFLPLCDIVLFVTSADRPFSESERLFLESIRKWGKKVILIVNKMDLLETAEAKDEVLRFVSKSAKSLLGSESKVFALSARMAKQAKGSPSGTESTQWKECGLASLEDYINENLDSVERLRLKLRASASVGKTLAEKYITVLSANYAVVSADREMLSDVELLLQRHEDSVRKGYPAHFARADNVLNDAMERADIFFDTHLRVANAWNLTNRAALEQSFDDEVVKGTAKSVQRQIHAVAEWLADASSKNLTDTTATFSRRVGERAREIDSLHKEVNIETQTSSLRFAGFPSGRDIEVSGTRERLVSRLTETAEELVGEYLSRKEGQRISERVASSVRTSTALGIGSLGSLTLFLLNASSVSPEVFIGDPAMPIVASGLGALAAAIVPRQRGILRAEVRSRIANIRSRLQNELRSRLEEQITSHMTGIRLAMQPFSDFSGQQAEHLQDRLTALSRSLDFVKKLDAKLTLIETPKSKMKD